MSYVSMGLVGAIVGVLIGAIVGVIKVLKDKNNDNQEQ